MSFISVGCVIPASMKRLMVLHGKVKEVCGRGIAGATSLSNQFKSLFAEYRFFAKDVTTKEELLWKARRLCSIRRDPSLRSGHGPVGKILRTAFGGHLNFPTGSS